MVEWELFSIHFFRTVTSKGFIVFYWTSRVICGFCFRQKGSPGMPGIFAIMTFGASLGKPNQLFYACFTVDPEFNVSPFQLSSSSLNPKWCEISHQTVRWRVSRHWSPTRCCQTSNLPRHLSMDGQLKGDFPCQIHGLVVFS